MSFFPDARSNPAISDSSVRERRELSQHDKGYPDNDWSAPLNVRGRHQNTGKLLMSTPWDPNMDSDGPIELTDSCTSSAIMSFDPKIPRRATTPLNPSLVHIPTLLVEYYFQRVCRDCSTFDSAFNPFRTMISNMRYSSASINHVIQSLSASKLAEDMPSMRLVGIEAQYQALETVKNECLAATTLHDVSDEVLCTILLLGMTTSWHVRDDLGLEYVDLAARVIAARTAAPNSTAKSNLEFFQSALKYWKMIVSLVSGAIDSGNEDSYGSSTPGPSLVQLRIMPHPWTGVSPQSQDLFGQALRLIRNIRIGFPKSTTSTFSRASIVNMSNAIFSAERLEEQCWMVSIPAIKNVEDTGDPSTPPTHHILTAEAYLLAALLHIYMIFPDVLDTRIGLISASESTRPALQADRRSFDSASNICGDWLWSQRSAADPREAWLRDIAFRIVECVESINVESSTRVVHPPLLLSVSTALTLVGGEDYSLTTHASDPLACSRFLDPSLQDARSMLHGTSPATDTRVHHCRQFILHRLEIMQAVMRFHAIENIRKVVKEVWRRSDAGLQDTFWMDVMSELHCESLFG